MIIRYTITTRGGICHCFSDKDLLTNLQFVIQQGIQILRVEKR